MGIAARLTRNDAKTMYGKNKPGHTTKAAATYGQYMNGATCGSDSFMWVMGPIKNRTVCKSVWRRDGFTPDLWTELIACAQNVSTCG